MVNAVLLTSAEKKDLIKGENKAFMYIAGRRVFEYVLDALYNSSSIENIYIIGPKHIEETKKQTKLAKKEEAKQPLTLEALIDVYRNDHGNKQIMFHPESREAEPWSRFHNNIISGFNLAKQENKEVLFSPADIPLANDHSIDTFIATCFYLGGFQHDLYYCIVNNDKAIEKYTQHVRKPYKLKEGNFRPGNLALVKPSGIKNTELIAKAFINSRKLSKISSIIKLAKHVGFSETGKQIALWLSGRSTISGIEEYISKAVDGKVKLVDINAPELEYDIDDENDFENIKRWIEDKKRYSARKAKVSLS